MTNDLRTFVNLFLRVGDRRRGRVRTDVESSPSLVKVDKSVCEKNVSFNGKWEEEILSQVYFMLQFRMSPFWS